MKILNQINHVKTSVVVSKNMSIGQYFWHKDGFVFACMSNNLKAWWS